MKLLRVTLAYFKRIILNDNRMYRIIATRYLQKNARRYVARAMCTQSTTSAAEGGEVKEERNYKYITYENLDKVCLIGLNRPEKRNAVNHEMASELRQAFTDYAADWSLHAAVLFGHGGNFCAGYDLEELSEVDGNPVDYLTNADGPMGPTRMVVNKPVIAAVNGYAVAGGLELALFCHMRIAEENAVFGVFCRRFGVPLIDGGTVRLPQLIGMSRAMDMILTGRTVRAKEALDWGLVTRLTETGCALGNATNLAHNLTKFPQQALRADMKSAQFCAFTGTPLWAKLMFEFRAGKRALTTESVDGAKRFVSGQGKHGEYRSNFQSKL